MVVAISGVCERSTNILKRKFWILLDNLLIGHPGGEPAENVVNRDAHSPDTWSSTAFAGLDGDEFTVVH